MEHLVLGKFIDQTNELTRFKIFSVIALLEVVEFFQHSDRDTDIVFVKVEDAVVFVDDY